MDTRIAEAANPICHVVALPYPGRGHINPMMNLCRSIASKTSKILITFIITEEWLCLLGSEQKPYNFLFATIPNVLTSERTRVGKFPAFFQEVLTKMEAPVDQLLDIIEPPVTVIVADTYLPWAFEMANRKNIPAASLWTMSMTTYSVLHYFDLIVQKGHFPIDLKETDQQEILVEYIPGVPSTRLADLTMSLYGGEQGVRDGVLKSIRYVSKAQFLLLCSAYELEVDQIEALRSVLSLPIYHIGPTIPYLKLQQNNASIQSDDNNYFQWLDMQPIASVLYISEGSIHATSNAQLDEIAAGLQDSGVRYFWVARGEASKLEEKCCGDMGLIVPWCDQLRVLCHPSIGGFWSHCGWSSTMEAVFSGIPMLTFPLYGDQALNSKLVVEDWKVGRRMKNEAIDTGKLVTREQIAELLRGFMDLENGEMKEMRRRAKEVSERCRSAIRKGGSSDIDLDNFIGDVIGNSQQ